MTPYYPTAELKRAAELLVRAQGVLVLSGAGLSKASGIPTYRDNGGLWTTGDNLKYADIDAYRKSPKSFAKFWHDRRKHIAAARPNHGHRALRELQQLKEGTTLATQNVDGLLQAAGCHSVLELHGNLLRSRCSRCSGQGRSVFGRCLRCFAPMRPDVTLFGETLGENIFSEAKRAATTCNVIVVVGTTAIVEPVAQLPILALRFGAKLVVIDTEPPPLASVADVVLQGESEVLLPELVERVRATSPGAASIYSYPA